MGDTRRRGVNWTLPDQKAGENFTWDHAQIAILMDIRDEMQTISSLLRCYRIPRALDAAVRIDKRLSKKINLNKTRNK